MIKEANIKKIVSKYVKEDSFFMIHENDPDLKPVKVYLPKAPDPELIDGYGLEPEDQKFKYAEVPQDIYDIEEQAKDELIEMENRHKNMKATGQKLLERCWEILESNKKKYNETIKWMQEQIYYLEFGYWFYCNGKPTYLDPWDYRYLNYWYMGDIEHPDYRDRDRRWFHFMRFAYTTTHNEKRKDIGFRTCFGVADPKHRRAGDTFKALCILFDIIVKNHESYGGIQSYDDNNAGEHYKNKLIPAWQKQPFFLKPMWRGSLNPQSKLVFELPDNKIAGEELRSKIDYATTSLRGFYDGKKLKFLLCEEEGKTIAENIHERWGVLKETLGQGRGAIIIGFSIHPSTVADMKYQGGQNFYHLCEESKFYERNEKSGQTKSGLFRLFMPAWDGLEGFIGPYGESVIENPTSEQAEFINRNYGSKDFLQSTLDDCLKDGSSEAMKKYEEQLKLFPMQYEHCWRLHDGHVGFNVKILDTRIAELKRDFMTARGRFFRIVNGRPMTAEEFIDEGFHLTNIDAPVEWASDPDGEWEISYLVPNGIRNKKIRMEDGHFRPEHATQFTTGVDTYKFHTKSEAKIKEDGDRMSNGGIATFYHRDINADHEGKKREKWVSNKFVCTYNHRPKSLDVFSEHALMQCEYFSSMMYPENNIMNVVKYFIERKRKGYLKYDIDPETLKVKDKPGYFAGTESKQKLFGSIRDYIEFCGKYENHIEFLLEVKRIKGIEEMTKYDLFAACGAALLGVKSQYGDYVSGFDDTDYETGNWIY